MDLSDNSPLDRDFKRAYLYFYQVVRNSFLKEIFEVGARLGYEKIVLSVLREIDPKDILDYYNRAMVEAAEKGHLEIVKLMLKLGVNEYNEAIKSAEIGKNPEIVKYIRRWKWSH